MDVVRIAVKPVGIQFLVNIAYDEQCKNQAKNQAEVLGDVDESETGECSEFGSELFHG
jgi:hypothetical protein